VPALLAVTCALTGTANAQTQFLQPPQAQSPSTLPQPGDAANIPDEKLGAAAAALQHVAEIKQDYEQRLATANDSDKQRPVDGANSALEKPGPCPVRGSCSR
jgi:hypothetical protein